MNNIDIIDKFYIGFSNLEAPDMNKFYAENIVFSDPVFGLLKGEQVRAMWTMLCKNAQNFDLAHQNIKDLGDGYYTCHWQANYLFSATGKKVTNNVVAHMKIEDGKITEHSDAFSFHKWASQAFGFTGWLLGWNRLFHRRVQNTARRNLLKFMEKEGS